MEMARHGEFFHKAAKDGSVDQLRETTRKDCNKTDDDGLSPTLWAAFYGNLDALRLLVGRGGNPDKCDLFGSTALHLAASNGHLNCVTFLVSFGCSLWALDNNLHTALDVAGLNNRTEVVKFLDFVSERQSVLSKKLVKKWKGKAIFDAQKRIQKLNKMKHKAHMRGEKDLKKLSKRKISLASKKTIRSEPKPYSAYLTSASKRSLFQGIKKKLKQRSGCKSESNGEFKIREIESNGHETIRSLSGLKRDSHIMYIRNCDTLSLTDSSSISCNEFSGQLSDTISKAISEPEMFNDQKSCEITFGETVNQTSMFERPGFGKVSFVNRRIACRTLMSFSWHVNQSLQLDTDSLQSENIRFSDKSERKNFCDYDNSSIGTLGSLEARMKTLPWDQDVVEEEEYFSQNAALEFFLASCNLSEYYRFFIDDDLDLQSMLLLTEAGLKEIGLPLGPRLKLLKAKSQRQTGLAMPLSITDSLV